MEKSEVLLKNCNLSRNDLTNIIANKDAELVNNQKEIQNLNLMKKSVRKKWIKNTLYFSGAALAVGLLTGILIAK